MAETDLPAWIEAVAKALYGEPNKRQSTNDELRFGTHGSLRVSIAGEHRGTWTDHESGDGGGVLDLIVHKQAGDHKSAAAWLRENIEGSGAANDAGQIVAVYRYEDWAGELVHEVVRYEPKSFRQRRPDGKGGHGLHMEPKRSKWSVVLYVACGQSVTSSLPIAQEQSSHGVTSYNFNTLQALRTFGKLRSPPVGSQPGVRGCMRTFRLVLVLLAFTIPVLAQAGIRVAPVAGTAASPAIASQTARAHVAGVVTAAAVVPSETNLPSNSPPNSLASTAVPTAPVGPVPRIALVIGNSAYDARIGSLATPSSDAQLIAAGLRAVGFDVEVVVDANQGMMKQAISQFGQRLTASGRGSTGLFYYAGHAMQSDGVNYLIPVGAAITKEADIDLKAVTADSVLSQMKAAGASLTIVILDASRNIAIASAFRGGTPGLAQINAPTNSFLGFSAAPGALAADGSGTNSSFALALNAELQLAGQPIEILFRKVRRTVLQASGGKQTPWVASSLIDSFVFKQE